MLALIYQHHGSVMGIQRWLGSPFKHRHFNGKVIELQWGIVQPSSHFRFLVNPGEKHQKGGDDSRWGPGRPKV
jgi:hypothetical protein